MRAGAVVCFVGLVLVLAFLSGGSQRRGGIRALERAPMLPQREGERGWLGLRELPTKSSGAQGQRPAHHDETSGITFVTMETDPDLSIGLQLNDFTRRTGAPVHNPGAGQTWTGYQFKIVAWQEFIASRRAELGQDADQELVVLVDNRDLFWAGCELSDLRERYEKVVKQSSASIVFNAEEGCYSPPQTCKKAPAPPHDFQGKATPWVGGCSLRCNSTWHDICTPCGHTHSAGYLNSGFIMGPMKPISQMLDWALEHLANYSAAISGFGDQAVFLDYWVKHPDLVTLDYGGELCMQAGTFHGINAYQVDTRSEKVFSPMLGGRPVCFIHGAGFGRMTAAWVLSQLRPGHPGHELALFEGGNYGNVSFDPVMPWMKVALPKFLRSPQNVHIPDGADNFLDIPTSFLRLGGTMSKVVTKYSKVVAKYERKKWESCPHSTCAAIAQRKHIDS